MLWRCTVCYGGALYVMVVYCVVGLCTVCHGGVCYGGVLYTISHKNNFGLLFQE